VAVHLENQLLLLDDLGNQQFILLLADLVGELQLFGLPLDGLVFIEDGGGEVDGVADLTVDGFVVEGLEAAVLLEVLLDVGGDGLDLALHLLLQPFLLLSQVDLHASLGDLEEVHDFAVDCLEVGAKDVAGLLLQAEGDGLLDDSPEFVLPLDGPQLQFGDLPLELLPPLLLLLQQNLQLLQSLPQPHRPRAIPNPHIGLPETGLGLRQIGGDEILPLGDE
jgi:hypothetical protein